MKKLKYAVVLILALAAFAPTLKAEEQQDDYSVLSWDMFDAWYYYATGMNFSLYR